MTYTYWITKQEEPLIELSHEGTTPRYTPREPFPFDPEREAYLHLTAQEKQEREDQFLEKYDL